MVIQQIVISIEMGTVLEQLKMIAAMYVLAVTPVIQQIVIKIVQVYVLEMLLCYGMNVMLLKKLQS